MTAAPTKLEEELRALALHVSPSPWIKSGVRSAYPERVKATWVGPDGRAIVGVVFEDRTPDLYKASMSDAQWVFLTQPDNILALLDTIASLRTRLETAEADRDAAQFAHRNGQSLAEDSIHAIRELLTAHNVPLSSFIDDHVGNAIFQRDQAVARAETAEALAEARREALEPFGRENDIPTNAPDDQYIGCIYGRDGIMVAHAHAGDFRRARTLTKEPNNVG